MIKDAAYVREWEANYLRSRERDFDQTLAYIEATLEFALEAGTLQSQYLPSEVEFKIEFARRLNGVKA